MEVTNKTGKCINLGYLKIYKHNEEQFIHLEWTVAPSSSEFREGMGKCLEVLAETGYKLLLSDTRRLGAISLEDQEWVRTHWEPIAKPLNLKKMAVLLGEDIFSQFSVNEILENTPQPREMKYNYFGVYDDATKWLLTID